MHTRLRVWKGATLHDELQDLVRDGYDLLARDCLAYTYYMWDEDADTVVAGGWYPWFLDTSANRLPLAIQEIDIDQLSLADSSGWVLFVWPPSNWTGADQPLPDHYQTWMGVAYRTDGGLSGAMTALPAANANCYSDQVIPNLGIGYDYVTSEGYVTSPP
jgi:hypothetical protein